MASYLPAETNTIPQRKLLPPKVEIVGAPRLDSGIGSVNMDISGVLVDEQDPPQPILDAEGKEQIVGTGQPPISISIAECCGRTYRGVTGVQVMQFIGDLFDDEISKRFPAAP